jgi:hypothetical protein
MNIQTEYNPTLKPECASDRNTLHELAKRSVLFESPLISL